MNIIRRYFVTSFKKMGDKGRPIRYSAADRNKDPIKDTLGQYLQKSSENLKQFFLEISSGTGQHIVYLAQHYPWLTYQPTEFDKSLLKSINAHIEQDNVSNVNPAAFLDAKEPPSKWLDGKIEENSVDYVLNINMIHISEFKCTEGLFYGCGKILKPGGLLFTYGPYAFDGKITPESNVRFDMGLKQQHPEWGLKDVKRDLEPLADKNGIQLVRVHSLPANNHLIVWQKKNE